MSPAPDWTPSRVAFRNVYRCTAVIGNRDYWRRIFTTSYLSEIDALQVGVIHRMVPSFNGLEAEADAAAKAEYERLGRYGGDGYGLDPEDAAEMAYDEGLAFYERMTSVRQGLLNLATAGIYHLYEQQAAHFLRRELITFREEHDADFMARLLKLRESDRLFAGRLQKAGISLKAFSSFPQLEELRLVANVVKHGAGQSAESLYKLRPDLFSNPVIRGLGGPMFPVLSKVPSSRPRHVRVERPMMGHDLYITADDYARYTRIVKDFWSELASSM